MRAGTLPLLFRIGVHLGDVIAEGDDVFGDGVNVAARLQSLADAGGIRISRQAYEQVEGKLGVTFRSLGEQTLKNIPRPIGVYAAEFGGDGTGVAVAGSQAGDQVLPRPGWHAAGLRHGRTGAGAGEDRELAEPPGAGLG